MRLKLTVQRQQNSHDLLVTADGTATVGDIAAALAAAHPSEPGEAVDPVSVTLRVADGTASSLGRLLDTKVSLIDSGLRSGMQVEVVGSPPIEATPVGQAAAVVRIVAGPGAGAEYSLPFGSSTIGRATDNYIVLRDDMVSKHHARISVGDGVEIIDQNSANGVMVGGQRVGRLRLDPDDIVTLGDTEFTVAQIRPVGLENPTSTDIPFNRSPNVLPHLTQRDFRLPETPKPPEDLPFPWVAMVAPLIMGGVMWLVTHQLISIIYISLSPIIMLGTFVDQYVRNKRRFKASVKRFIAAIARDRQKLSGMYDQDRTDLITVYPSVSDIWSSAIRLGTMLWWRRPEHPAFLRLRLGIGNIPPFVTFTSQERRDGIPEYERELEAVIHDFATLEDAPVVADLKVCGSLGICGDHNVLDGVARGIMVELICGHSPAEVVVACLTSRAGVARWGWLQWLPHTSSPHSPLGSTHLACDALTGSALLARIEELIEARTGAKDPKPRGPVDKEDLVTDPQVDWRPCLPSVVVLVDDTSIDRARLTRVTERGPDAGVHLIWCAQAPAEIPAACRTYLEVSDQGSFVGRVRQGNTIIPVQVETIDTAMSDLLARILSPVLDAGVPIDDASDLPKSVSLVSLTGQELASSPDAVTTRWRENQSILDRRPDAPVVPMRHPVSLRALVGHAGSDMFTLDLKSQGPHALVGGTTGAGKSEFLQAWVLGMAVGHSPDRLAFLFVDYKGGSAFARCLDLPHVVGLVTDLSPYLVRRALTSLRAELRFREQLLNQRAAKDLAELEQRGDPMCPPSLIIVVDEFAALATEIPEFVDGVVDVAQRGRSLGMHLIMATQRPSGVIKDNLRANTNLRVALRMADDTDSLDVLGEKTAAFFDPSTPGRAAAKTGPGRIVQFQAGYPGARTPVDATLSPVYVSEMDFGSDLPWRLPERKLDLSHVDTDIDRLVSTMVRAAQQEEIPAPRKPWLAELAAVYDLARLPGHRDDSHLVLGVLDDPNGQQQPVVMYEPDRDGNLAIIGASGSGKTTALRTIVASSVFATRIGGPVWVYALDFASGGLSMLEDLPNVGAVIRGDDEERVIRLLRTLRATVDERSIRYQKVSASGIGEYRRLANAPQEARILLLVDGMSAFREEYEFSNRARWFTAFAQIAADGRPLGVHIIMTGDRTNAIPTSINSTVQRRIVLRLPSEDDYLTMGAPKDILTSASPPGRGILDGAEIQLGVLGADPNVAVQARTVAQLAQAARERAEVVAAPGIGVLPTIVSMDDLPVSDSRGFPVFALADEDLAGVGTEPRGALMVAGPPGAGRTNALVAIASAITRHTQAGLSQFETILIAPTRTSVVARLAWGRVARGDDAIIALAEELIAELADGSVAAGRYAIFVDALTDFTGTPAEDALDRLLVAAVKNDQFVVGEGQTATWSQAWTLAKTFKAARRGLVLVPDEMDTDQLTGTNVGRIRVTDFPPGRGFLIGGGTGRKIQVALVEP
ncbi:MAG: FtsK/SpoIIIE domain-containing protein [Propionibacteriaceae bacterium]|nr:FtsK/SpoIIIE domain-containing protein [Propionibacteriaceae bacterium]